MAGRENYDLLIRRCAKEKIDSIASSLKLLLELDTLPKDQKDHIESLIERYESREKEITTVACTAATEFLGHLCYSTPEDKIDVALCRKINDLLLNSGMQDEIFHSAISGVISSIEEDPDRRPRFVGLDNANSSLERAMDFIKNEEGAFKTTHRARLIDRLYSGVSLVPFLAASKPLMEWLNSEFKKSDEKEFGMRIIQAMQSLKEIGESLYAKETNVSQNNT